MSANSMTRRLVPVALALAVIAAPAPAFAEDTGSIDIDAADVPTTVEEHGVHSCEQLDDLSPTQDGWIFALPDGTEGELGTVTARFKDAEGNESLRENTDFGNVIRDADGKVVKVYILTPGRWTLVDATAEAVGVPKGTTFNLTHTCVGERAPDPSDSASASDSAAPGDDSGNTGDGDVLPVTGSGLTMPLLAGLLLAAAGVAVLVTAQRRRILAMRDDD